MTSKRDSIARMMAGQDLHQGDELKGIYKGIVEDTQDPFGLGRLRVRIYSLHGSPLNTPSEKLPWSEAVVPFEGAFDPPEVHDRVWILFEHGHRYNPVWIGHWWAIPTGQGDVPFSKRQGSEVPREVWANFKRRPQAKSLARSNEGNQIWFTDQTCGDDFIGSLMLQDTGGKTFGMQTFHTARRDYDPEDPEGTRHRVKDIARLDQGTGHGAMLLDMRGYSNRVRQTVGLSLRQEERQEAPESTTASCLVNGKVARKRLGGRSTTKASVALHSTSVSLTAPRIVSMGKSLALPRGW